MSPDEVICLGTSEIKKVQQKSQITIEFRRNVECRELLLGVDGVDQRAHVLGRIKFPGIDEVSNELDHPHLTHQTRIEGKRGSVIENCSRGPWNLGDVDRIDLHDEDILSAPHILI